MAFDFEKRRKLLEGYESKIAKLPSLDIESITRLGGSNSVKVQATDDGLIKIEVDNHAMQKEVALKLAHFILDVLETKKE